MTARDRRVIAVVLSLAVIVAAWLLVIQPKRTEASSLGKQITTAQQQLNTAKAQVATETADEHAYPQNYASVARLGEAVPADDDSGSLIYQLQAAAQKAGIDFRSLVLAPAAGGTAPTPATSTATTSTSSSSSSATLPPGVAVGPAGFPVLPFTFTFNGNFFNLANFFGRLQHFVVVTGQRIHVSGRLMTLNSISLAPGPMGFPQITATISATTYLEPTTIQSDTTTPSTPSTSSTTSQSATTSTPQPTSTSAPSPAPAAIASPTP
jgi:hypothetical protein